MEKPMILAESNHAVAPEPMQPVINMPVETNASLGASVRSTEESIILQTLRDEKGSRKITAEKLGISPRTLRYKIARMKDAGVAVPC